MEFDAEVQHNNWIKRVLHVAYFKSDNVIHHTCLIKTSLIVEKVTNKQIPLHPPVPHPLGSKVYSIHNNTRDIVRGRSNYVCVMYA